MIDVVFRSVRRGTCGWCRKEHDTVFDVSFSDRSFTGPLCTEHLLRQIDMKLSVQYKPSNPNAPDEEAAQS